MGIGNFNETSESKDEVQEADEAIDNTEKPRNQILETPESYDDDFDSKLDSVEKNESRTEGGESEQLESNENGEGERHGLLDRMRDLFSRKESGNESEADTNETDDNETDSNDFSSKRNSFLDSLRVDAPSTEDQAETAKKRQEGSENESGSDAGESSDAQSEEHGEDGERTRWSDAQWAREHERE